ncbi:MAG: hypothetical protein EOP42_07235 [Sphingobacteriaceae bacterium]|nr:MAG: hypothetical protein EOP42_07235 [Sphingobacteriaceae bacterium]
MKDTPPGDVVSKNPKATLITTITAILEASIQHIKNAELKEIAIPLAPFIAFIITTFFKTLYKKYKCWSTIKMQNGWISDLETELNSGITAGRKKEILQEILLYKSEIKKVEKDSIGIDFN